MYSNLQYTVNKQYANNTGQGHTPSWFVLLIHNKDGYPNSVAYNQEWGTPRAPH